MGEKKTKIQKHSKCVKSEKSAKDVGVNSAEKEIVMRTERNRERCLEAREEGETTSIGEGERS